MPRANKMLTQLLYHFLIVVLVTSIPTAFWIVMLKRWGRLPQHAIHISALAAFAGTAYLTFWAFFAGRSTGLVSVYAVYGISTVCLVIWRKQLKAFLYADREILLAHILVILIGFSYIGILCTTAAPANADALDRSAHRFNELPGDNLIPVVFADRLERNESVRHLFGDEHDAWLSSDRPPLQTGIILSVRPILMNPVFRAIGMRSGHSGFASSVWFQLFWIPAVWALLRALGANAKQSAAVIVVTACTGFCLLYSIYTWPKFGAAALVIGGVSLIITDRSEHSTSRWVCAAGMFSLAHLSHGGSDFALIALPVLIFVPALRPTIRECVIAVILFITISAPWVAYQKLYDPPGDRLLKMHLAGVNDVDSRSILTALQDRYREIGWTGFLENRRANFAKLVEGDFHPMIDFNFQPDAAQDRRNAEFFFFFRALAFGNIALIVSPLLIFLLGRKSTDEQALMRKIVYILGFAILSLMAWCFLMFMPGSCVIHQGSLVPLLTVYSTAMLLMYRYSWVLFCVVSCLQFTSFLTTWVPENTPLGTSGDLTAYIIIGTSAFGLLLATLFIKNQSVEQSVA